MVDETCDTSGTRCDAVAEAIRTEDPVRILQALLHTVPAEDRLKRVETAAEAVGRIAWELREAGRVDEAVEVIGLVAHLIPRLPRAADRAAATCDVADELVRCGRIEMARPWLSKVREAVAEARRVAQPAAPPLKHSEIIGDERDPERIRELIQTYLERRTSETPADPDRSLFPLSYALAQAAMMEEAREFASLMESQDERESAIGWLALALAHTGQLGEALRLFDGLPSEVRDCVLSSAAWEETDFGDIDLAQALVEQIRDSEPRIEALRRLAEQRIARGARVEARVLLTEVLELLSESGDPEHRDHNLSEVAKLSLRADDLDPAQRAAEPIGDLFTRNELFARLARTYYRAGRTTDAEAAAGELLRNARTEAPETSEPKVRLKNRYRSHYLQLEAAATLCLIGRVAEGEALFDALREAGSNEEDRELGGVFNSHLAQMVGFSGRLEEALALIAAADQPGSRQSAVERVTHLLIDDGRPGEAERFVHSVPDEWLCHEAWENVAAHLQESGDLERAQDAYGRAAELALRIEGPLERASEVSHAGLHLVFCGLPEDASALIERCPEPKPRHWYPTAVALARKGNREGALRLIRHGGRRGDVDCWAALLVKLYPDSALALAETLVRDALSDAEEAD